VQHVGSGNAGNAGPWHQCNGACAASRQRSWHNQAWMRRNSWPGWPSGHWICWTCRGLKNWEEQADFFCRLKSLAHLSTMYKLLWILWRSVSSKQNRQHGHPEKYASMGSPGA
jgi:hypothetical protein